MSDTPNLEKSIIEDFFAAPPKTVEKETPEQIMAIADTLDLESLSDLHLGYALAVHVLGTELATDRTHIGMGQYMEGLHWRYKGSNGRLFLGSPSECAWGFDHLRSMTEGRWKPLFRLERVATDRYEAFLFAEDGATYIGWGAQAARALSCAMIRAKRGMVAKTKT